MNVLDFDMGDRKGRPYTSNRHGHRQTVRLGSQRAHAPQNPGSRSEEWEALLECWENSPENTSGCDWVIAPTGNSYGRVVGDDYPYQADSTNPATRHSTSRPWAPSKKKFRQAIGGDRARGGKAGRDNAQEPGQKAPSRR